MNKDITIPAAGVTSAAIILARKHFIGPLNEHFNSVKGREVVATFRIHADPLRCLHTPLDIPVKRAVVTASIFFTQSFEAYVRAISGKTEIETSILTELVLDLLVKYAEYKDAFKNWTLYDIPIAYRHMQNALIALRRHYMTLSEDATEEMPLLNDMLYLMNHMTTLENAYPDLLRRLMQTPPQPLNGEEEDMNNAGGESDDDDNLIPE